MRLSIPYVPSGYGLAAPPNYPLRHPNYHLIETIRPLIELQWGDFKDFRPQPKGSRLQGSLLRGPLEGPNRDIGPCEGCVRLHWKYSWLWCSPRHFLSAPHMGPYLVRKGLKYGPPFWQVAYDGISMGLQGFRIRDPYQETTGSTLESRLMELSSYLQMSV